MPSIDGTSSLRLDIDCAAWLDRDREHAQLVNGENEGFETIFNEFRLQVKKTTTTKASSEIALWSEEICIEECQL